MNDKEILDSQLEAWKEIVTTQRHFNDVCMKVRHLGFILVAALLAFGAIFWIAIWFLDVKWYTPFLLGSVKAGLDVESQINQRMTELKLTQRIKEASANSSILGLQLSSSRRAPLFHSFMVVLLLSMAFLLTFFENSSVADFKGELSTEQLVGKDKNTT
ncbi:hypothetical protein DFP83_1302 [Idiomarina fontislapidosi]|uniref:Uncharacterized protein n=1 Tax=Idiomarina fontislapidosi TaxID=263723 RepID=A0A432XJN6_9GAMM|nr:hypothetical protein [Idiomarina fontislapidosi]PYE30069.1 hypothetical protein DFP83_1302 [Idiomarina fontislapidosi]RUO48920.1 hypothetical protein CWE25_13040 [Idiomarina fontislapidosi]|tara:strand:- start:2697 stop:3173 length:477 start_codon:yes stop_codon:yes gene_type:complete